MTTSNVDVEAGSEAVVNSPDRSQSSFKSNVIGILVVLVFLWNWDGFWHTNIKFLNDVQIKFFPKKFIEEQKKLDNVSENKFVFDFYDEALSKQRVQITKLSSAAEVEEKKCVYLKTSLRIIKHMTQKMSADDLTDAVRCTNDECDDILNGNREKLNICN